jgi:hypothetical protein
MSRRAGHGAFARDRTQGGETALNLLIVGCSRRKLDTTIPVPALELYQGWCIPQVRARVGTRPELRRQTLILSARHGLVDADTALLAYDQRMSATRARELRSQITETLHDRVVTQKVGQALLLLEASYMRALADFLGQRWRPRVRWVLDPVANWNYAEAVLDAWGWA